MQPWTWMIYVRDHTWSNRVYLYHWVDPLSQLFWGSEQVCRVDNVTNKFLWTPCAISVIWCKHLVAGGGVWSTFPVLFPKMSMEFFVHGIITAILAFNTLFNFCVAAFSSAGPSPHIEWGKYELVGRKALEGYRFCGHCNLPKPPNAHHCRSCGACVVDMDHHCPFVCEIAFSFLPTAVFLFLTPVLL